MNGLIRKATEARRHSDDRLESEVEFARQQREAAVTEAAAQARSAAAQEWESVSAALRRERDEARAHSKFFDTELARLTATCRGVQADLDAARQTCFSAETARREAELARRTAEGEAAEARGLLEQERKVR